MLTFPNIVEKSIKTHNKKAQKAQHTTKKIAKKTFS